VRARTLQTLLRLGPTLLVLALLVATAAAFAQAQRQKLEPSPIGVLEVSQLFSPVCECPQDRARIALRLRQEQELTLDVVDADDRRVRRLVRLRSPVTEVDVAWDGRDDRGRVLPDGLYRPRIVLERDGRALLLPNRIRLDTTPPRVELVRLGPRVLDPRAGGPRRLLVEYRLSEVAQPRLLIEGPGGSARVVGRRRQEGGLEWFARIEGEFAEPGTYEVVLDAVDAAGNVADPVGPELVEVR
jgi:hypothetical protein